MITDDDLRALLTSDEIPGSLSPTLVRARAQRIRRRRRLGTVALTVLVVPVLALFTLGLPGRGPSSINVAAGYPPAFDGNGNALTVGPDGKVALKIPHLYAYTGPGDLCWGSDERYGLGGMCYVDHFKSEAVDGISIGNGLIGSITVVPVARADFIVGTHVAHAQVVGFAKYPSWRTLTAAWDGPESDAGNVLVRGWDSSGKLILSEGCLGGCPMPVEPTPAAATGAPVPAASSAPPASTSTLAADGLIAVLPGVEAYPAAHGVCVGDQNSSQCVTDGDTAIDDGFALGKGIAVTIIGKPLAKAEFLVGTTPVQATVLGFASHPQWRVVAANLKLPDSAGKPVSLKGWDADGKLIASFDPTATNPEALPKS